MVARNNNFETIIDDHDDYNVCLLIKCKIPPPITKIAVYIVQDIQLDPNWDNDVDQK